MTSEFAATWSSYDLDAGTRSLLAYAEKLTLTPGRIDESDTAELRDAGWTDDAIYEVTALVAFFNFSGRLEAASGLPPDEVPGDARLPEARLD